MPLQGVTIAGGVCSGNIIDFPDKKAEDRAGSGAKQPDYDVRHDESAGSRHGKTSRHGAAGGKKLNTM